MAIAKDMNWYVRAGGAETNGGGYDGTTYPGGVNYADQDSPQVSITDLTSTNSTTVTSVLSTFTSNMVGNVLRIASGTGATTGYYVIATYVDANTLTLDRVSGTYTAGVAKVGGAHASITTYANGGGGAQPTLATPLVAGNTINIRGAGSTDPAVGSPDYSYAAGSYWSYPNGTNTAAAGGLIKVIGYNGRPLIKGEIVVYSTSSWEFQNLKFIPPATSTFNIGTLYLGGSSIHNCIFDQNGLDTHLLDIGAVSGNNVVYENEFRNTGGGAVGIYAAILMNAGYGDFVFNNWIHGMRTNGIEVSDQVPEFIFNNIIANNGKYGILVTNVSLNSYTSVRIINNTIDNNGSDGIHYNAGDSSINAIVYNNIISNHSVSGKYGINLATAPNATRTTFFIDYNNYYNNTSNYNNISAGANDKTVNPQYTNSAGNDYSISGSI